jgi:hypothetical protein
VPFQPWAKALYDERAAGKFWREEPDANCLPQGVPKVLFAPAPWRIVQTPKIVFFVHEAFNLWWQAFMDGRRFELTPDVAPRGTATRRRRGRARRWSSRAAASTAGVARPTGQAVDRALHVTTRFHRETSATWTSASHRRSEGITQPWGTSVAVTLLPETQLMEFICLENEKKTGGTR